MMVRACKVCGRSVIWIRGPKGRLAVDAQVSFMWLIQETDEEPRGRPVEVHAPHLHEEEG